MDLEEQVRKSNERAKELGRLIGEKIKKENPGLTRGLRRTMKGILKKYDTPFYIRAYEKIKSLYKG